MNSLCMYTQFDIKTYLNKKIIMNLTRCKVFEFEKKVDIIRDAIKQNESELEQK